uniref:H15 domain-containing protein n=1 Tax=Acrobeloides nanus TaxID=290746 RepID=A0A914EER8_9BILA
MSDSQQAKANNLQEAKSDTNVSTSENVTEASNADFVTPKSTGEPIRVPGRKKKAIRVSKQKRVNKTYPLRDLETIHRPGEHPSYKQMIDEAIFSLDSRKGVSRAAIKNYIAKKYPVGDRNGAINTHIRKAIKDLVEQKALILVEGATQKSSRYRLAAEVKQRMKKDASKAESTPPKPKSEQVKKAGEAKKRKAPTAAKTKGTEAKKAKKTSEAKKKVVKTRKSAQEKHKINVVAKPKVKKSSAKKTPHAAIKKLPAATSKKSAKAKTVKA